MRLCEAPLACYSVGSVYILSVTSSQLSVAHRSIRFGRYDRKMHAYIPCNKAWIKARALQHLSKVAEY